MLTSNSIYQHRQAQYYSAHNKKRDMGETYSTHGRNQEFMVFPFRNLNRRWSDIITDVKEEEEDCENMDWIQLAHERAQLRNVVNTANNFPSSIKGSEFIQNVSDYEIIKRDSC
jgi:hypothetical protein